MTAKSVPYMTFTVISTASPTFLREWFESHSYQASNATRPFREGAVESHSEDSPSGNSVLRKHIFTSHYSSCFVVIHIHLSPTTPSSPPSNNPMHVRFHLIRKPEMGGKSSLGRPVVPLLREATCRLKLELHSLDTLSSSGRHAVESLSTCKEVDLEATGYPPLYRACAAEARVCWVGRAWSWPEQSKCKCVRRPCWHAGREMEYVVDTRAARCSDLTVVGHRAAVLSLVRNPYQYGESRVVVIGIDAT
jgi:hypothetical protein